MKLTKLKLTNMIKEVIKEGILQQMEAEKILRDEFFSTQNLQAEIIHDIS